MACNKLQVGKLKVLGEGYGLVESNQAEIRIPIPSGKFVKPGQLIGFTGRDVWLPVDKGVLSPHLQDHEDLRAPVFPSFRGTVVRCDNSDGAASSSSSSSSTDPKLCVLVAEKASSSTLSFSGPASDTDEQMLPHQLKLAVGSSADMEVEAEEEKEQEVASTSRSRQSTTSTTAQRKGSGSSISIGGVGAGGSSASSGVLSLSACSPGPPDEKAGEILREKISSVDAEKGTTMKAELPSEIVAAASRNLRDSLTEGDKIACGIDVESGRVCAPVWKLLGVLEESQAVKAGTASAGDSTGTRERGEQNDVNMTCAGGGAGAGDASSANNERGRPPVISIPCTIHEAGEQDGGTGDVDMADAPGTAPAEAVAKPADSEDSGKGTRAAQATATSTSQQGQKLYSLLNKNGAQHQVSQTIQPPLDANNPLSNQSFRNRRGALPGDEDIDTNLENIRMGTVTSTITPDGDHTVILTQNREMLFAQTDMLANFLIPPGTDVACSVFTNEDGHPVVDPAKPIWELSTPFKEEQTPFFGQYYGRVINLSSHGNGFVDCECLKQEYGHDPFIHAKIMRLCQIRLGDLINFTVHINSSGTPQVSAPVWRKCVPPGQEISFAALEAAAAEAAAREANSGGMGSCNGSGNGGKGGKRGGGCNAGDGGGPLSLPLPGLAANSNVNRTNSGRSSSPDGLGALAAALGVGPTANDSNDLQTKSHNSMPSSSSGSFHAAHTGSGVGGGGAASSSSGSSAANFNNTAALISSSSSLMITETGELQQTNSNHAAPNLPSHPQLSAPAEPFGAGAGGPAQVQPPSMPSPQMSASIPSYGPAAAVGAPRPPHLAHGPYTGAAFTADHPPGPHHASQLHPPPPPLQPGGHGQHAPVHHVVNPHHPPPMNAQHSHSSPLLNPNMMVPTGAPHPQQQHPSPPLPHQPQPPPPLAQLHPGLHPHWAANVTSHLVSSHGGMQQFQVQQPGAPLAAHHNQTQFQQLPPNPRNVHSRDAALAMYDKAVGVLNSLGNNQGPAQQGGETSWEFVGALANSEEARNPEKVGRYEGYIKNVNHHGHGFVSLPSFPDNDVFVHKKVMERCKLFAEDRLRFNVHVNGSGTAQCSAPVWVLRCSRPHTHPGTRAPQVQPPPPTGHGHHVPYY